MTTPEEVLREALWSLHELTDHGHDDARAALDQLLQERDGAVAGHAQMLESLHESEQERFRLRAEVERLTEETATWRIRARRWENSAERYREALAADRPVIEYVSRGRGFVGVEPYPDSQARRALALHPDVRATLAGSTGTCPTCGRWRDEPAQYDEEGRFVMDCPDPWHRTTEEGRDDG